MQETVTPIRKLPPLRFQKRNKEWHSARVSSSQYQEIEPFRMARGMGKGEALHYLLERSFELTPIYERLWEQLNQMSKVRGLSPVEMLDLLIEVGLEALLAHESAIADKQNRFLFEEQDTAQ